MFVCMCNGLRDRDIAQAAQAGARTIDQAYAALGAQPACGHCFEEAEAVIAEVIQGGRRCGAAAACAEKAQAA